MKYTLTVVPVSHPETEHSRDTPRVYTVVGLPYGEAASIAKIGTVWQVLRVKERRHTDWFGHFDSAEAALQFLQDSFSE